LHATTYRSTVPTTIATAQAITFGKTILPIKRVETFSAEEWEQFVEEWLDVKEKDYLEIELLGGAGDMGRDVAAYVSDNKKPGYTWDCYQCKHYDRPIMPTQVYVEIGKIIYYTSIGHFPVPRKYYFVAPKGCGTSLSNLLKNAGRLRHEVKKNWLQYCENEIISKKSITLDTALSAYIDAFDFTIFEKIAVKVIIEEHTAHANHLSWFGGGLPERTEITEGMLPAAIAASESMYVSQLLLAYGSEKAMEFKDTASLTDPYGSHFKRARLNFHYAEQLRNLYRDSLPTGTFEKFQEEIYDGVVNVYEATHTNGYEKVKAVENQAVIVTIASNPLKDVSVQKDKLGICHQLCNEEKLKWIVN